MSKIIALGGGEIRQRDTLKIDKEIIKLSGKLKPRLLFLPTASSDSAGYIEDVKKYFGNFLGCKVSTLCLIKNKLTKQEIRHKIINTDIIYVGGGNTLRMMTLWRKFGVDKLLEEALKKDIVLCGLSAGSICWFDYGNSDSRKFTSNSKQLIKVKGLGFIKALHCPHYDVERHRQKDLKRMMKSSPLISIALENCCALEIKDNNFRIIKNKKSAKAYKIYWKNKKYYKKIISEQTSFMPLKDLLSK